MFGWCHVQAVDIKDKQELPLHLASLKLFRETVSDILNQCLMWLLCSKWLCAARKMLSATWNLLKVTIELANIYEKDNISTQCISKRKISWKETGGKWMLSISPRWSSPVAPKWNMSRWSEAPVGERDWTPSYLTDAPEGPEWAISESNHWHPFQFIWREDFFSINHQRDLL